MTTWVYIRVSTDKQVYDRQIHYLQQHGYKLDECEVVTETFTGTKKSRPQWDAMVERMQKGDTLVVESLSRIGRSLLVILDAITYIVEKKMVNVIILKENFNLKANGNMDATTRMMLSVFGAFAQFERDMISERTKESLASKENLGRPRNDEKRNEIIQMIKEGKGASEIAFLADTSRSNVYKLKKEYGL